MTTKVKGVDEVVIDGKTGYIAMTDDTLIEKIFTIGKKYKEMVPYCYYKSFDSYNVQNTANNYLDLWYKGDG